LSEENENVDKTVEGKSGVAERVIGKVSAKLRKTADVVGATTERIASHERDVRSYGKQAAEWLDTSADYVSDIDPQQLRISVTNGLRRNIAPSLIAAAMLGLVAGLLLRRRPSAHTGDRA